MSLSFELPVPLDETEAPESAPPGTPTPLNALMALAMRQEAERKKQQEEANAALRGGAARQRQQAQGMRNIALLSSIGDNPLLRGMQAEAGGQGEQLEGMAARAESQVAAPTARPLNPLDMLRALGTKGAKPTLSDDPNSPASKAAQARVKAIIPSISDADLATVTAASEPNFLKYRSMTEGRVQRGQEFAKMLGFKWADLNQDEQLAILRLSDAKEAREAAAAAKKAEQDAGATERLGKEVVGTGAPGFYARYDEAQTILGKVGKDVPGFGRIEGHLPEEMISDEGRQLRRLVGQLLSEYRKGQTGAGMSDAERIEYGRITGLVNSGNDASLKQGLEILKRAIDERVKATGAGFRPEAVDTLSKRSPRLGQALKGETQAPQRTPATQAMPKDESGNLALEAPPVAPPSSGDFVKVISPDGTPGRIPRANLEKAKAKGYKEAP